MGARSPAVAQARAGVRGRWRHTLAALRPAQRDADGAGDAEVERGRNTVGDGDRDGASIGDRAKAIETALNDLAPGDVLVVAGKGHEQGQIVGDTVLPFDDAGVIRRLAGTEPQA